MDEISGQCTAGIWFRLRLGTALFADLMRQVLWISERVLMRHLPRWAVVQRTDHGSGLPRVDHGLTDHGITLRPLLTEIGLWGTLHLNRHAKLQK